MFSTVPKAAGAARVVLRYGERLFTHEATFRALAGLRVWLFSGMARGSAGGLGFAKAGDALSRLVSDVDALDGLYLRISVPLLGGLVLVPILLFVSCGFVVSLLERTPYQRDHR